MVREREREGRKGLVWCGREREGGEGLVWCGREREGGWGRVGVVWGGVGEPHPKWLTLRGRGGRE